MKLRMIVTPLLAFSLLLSGCGTKTGSSESPSPSSSESETPSLTPDPSASKGESLLEGFREKALANGPAHELFKELELSLSKSEPAESDGLIRTMDAYYQSNLPATEKAFEPENVQQSLQSLNWPFTEEQIDGIKDEQVRSLVEETLAGGYKLETAEGYVFPVVDYGKLRAVGEQSSTAMKAYLDLMAMESDDKSASDGGLVIDWDELSRRTLAAESYIIAFPDSPERKTVEQRFLQYLTFYLVGLPNTPIFDYDTFKLLPEVKAQYETMISSHAGTITGGLTKELMNLLGKTGELVFKKGDKGEQTDIPEVKEFRDAIETTAKSKLPAGKKE